MEAIGSAREQLWLWPRSKPGPGTHAGIRYYLTSCSDALAVLTAATRRNLTIENSLHWGLAVVFREDEARSRGRVATRNFAVLCKQAFNLLQQGKH